MEYFYSTSAIKAAWAKASKAERQEIVEYAKRIKPSRLPAHFRWMLFKFIPHGATKPVLVCGCGILKGEGRTTKEMDTLLGIHRSPTPIKPSPSTIRKKPLRKL